MKQYLREHKGKIALSVFLTLLPILFGLLLWQELPDTMLTHWGADGAADGAMTKAKAIFVPNGILCLLNLLVIFSAYWEKKNRKQNPKVVFLLFWLVPCISLMVNTVMYGIALGSTLQMTRLLPVFLGLLFLIIGNYMPKTQQNRTLGIKIKWTFGNRENWNKTHRLAGKLWVLGGIAMLLCACLPIKFLIVSLLGIIAVLIAVPFIYSYCLYRAHRKAGIVYEALPETKADKVGKILALVLVPVILIGAAVVMFTGSITYTFSETALRVDCTYYESISVPYAEIDSVELLESVGAGMRIMGFGSAKLSVGQFENDILGTHTRYTYNSCNVSILIQSRDRKLVIGGETPAQTQSLYETLLTKIP